MRIEDTITIAILPVIIILYIIYILIQGYFIKKKKGKELSRKKRIQILDKELHRIKND